MRSGARARARATGCREGRAPGGTPQPRKAGIVSLHWSRTFRVGNRWAAPAVDVRRDRQKVGPRPGSCLGHRAEMSWRLGPRFQACRAPSAARDAPRPENFLAPQRQGACVRWVCCHRAHCANDVQFARSTAFVQSLHVSQRSRRRAATEKTDGATLQAAGSSHLMGAPRAGNWDTKRSSRGFWSGRFPERGISIDADVDTPHPTASPNRASQVGIFRSPLRLVVGRKSVVQKRNGPLPCPLNSVAR